MIVPRASTRLNSALKRGRREKVSIVDRETGMRLSVSKYCIAYSVQFIQVFIWSINSDEVWKIIKIAVKWGQSQCYFPE